MRSYRGPEGDQRIWFDEEEIEAIAEDELKRAKLLPTLEQPVTDLERFVEGHLGAALDQYAHLEPGILGLTRFIPGAPPAISISTDLTGSALDGEDPLPGLRGRWRATLAHEASHVLLHRFLFEVNPDQGQLFGVDDPSSPSAPLLFRCLKRDVGFRAGRGDWREVQANRGMGALLMPRSVFKRAARAELAGHAGARPDDDARVRLVVGALAERFDVSRQAARIRLTTLKLVSDPAVPSLPSLSQDTQ